MATHNEQKPGGDKSKYLGNHVYTTEAGHMIEVDNSPGDRRIHIYHASGTFIEIKDDGARVSKIVQKDQEYNENGKDQKITGNFNLTIDGDVITHVTGNIKTEVKGDYELVVHGDYRIKSAGNHFQETGGDERVQVNGKTSHRSTGDREHITGGNSVESIGADRTVTTTGNSVKMTGGNGLTSTGGEQSIIAGGSMGVGAARLGIASVTATAIRAGSTINMEATSTNTIKGSTIQLNP
jgi:hypothetical protein